MKLCANRHCLFGLVIPSAARAAAAPYAAVDLYPLNLPDGYGYGLNVFGGVGNPVAPGQIIGNSDPSSAVLWNAPNGASAFLPAAYVRPSGLSANNHGVSTDGVHQVGDAAFSLDDFHAVLWNGPGGPAVDLHPTALGFLNSGATGVSGNQQVGWGQRQFYIAHALLWNGTPQSAVDLHQASWVHSYATATDETHQVGWAEGLQSTSHAILWNGTAASAVDLHPAGVGYSQAFGVEDGQQVGAGDAQAFLWSGTAASAVNLHPTLLSEFVGSHAWDTNGINQVGMGHTAESARGLLWAGTAESAVDLHSLLPPGFSQSIAYTIDPQGVVYGVALTDDLATWHAVKWAPAPEPTTLALTAIPLLAARRLRRRL